MIILNNDNEVLFKIDADPKFNKEYSEGIHLKHLETDDIGLKMGGDLPNLWEINGDKLVGPELYDDDHQYKVLKVDYDNALIWLLEI